MREIVVIGVGAGDPDQVTMQAVSALNRVDVFFVLDKGAVKQELVDLRAEILRRHATAKDYRVVVGPDGGITLGPPLALAVSRGGRVEVSGRWGPERADLTATLSSISAALAGRFLPDMSPEGTLSGTVRVTGPVAEPEVQATLRGNGLRPGAAWSAGLPALVFDFPNVAARVRASGAGWVVPHQDVAALHDAILAIAENPAEMERAAAAAAAWQQGTGIAMTTPVMAQCYRAIYRSLLRPAAPARPVVAVVAPGLVANSDPLRPNDAEILSSPSGAHLLGTDYLGRDLWSRLIYGTVRTFVGSAIAVLIGMGVGTALGLVAARGGRDMAVAPAHRALLAEGATLAVTMEDARTAPHAGPSGPPVAAGKITIL